MISECERCHKKIAKGVVCSYCGRYIGFECLKASKRVKRRDVSKINICKDCWNKSEFRKMYKNNEIKIKVEFTI